MNPKHADLFAPLKIGAVTLRNRIVCPPMVQLRPIASPEGIGWYRRLAAGGVGLVIVEATGIPHFGKELTAKTLRPLTDAVHREGAAIAIQLFPIVFGTTADPNELSAEQIESIMEGYANAAAVCRDAGFDGVEPHGAHGFLLNQIFMPDRNRRTDDYGGSFDNRCRIGVEIVNRIRRAAGDRLLILYRHTPAGNKYTVDESVAFARKLTAAGVDVMDISPARKEIPGDLAAPFKAALSVPVIAVQGMNNPDAAAQALRDGRCDLVAIGRNLISDAQWPAKVRDGRIGEIVMCKECNAACFGNLHKGKHVNCVQWKKDEVASFVA